MQGCYTPLYNPASFKGFSLAQCTDADSEGGRRGASGEFPFGEKTAYADLGIRIRHFHLKGYYGANDHIALSEGLIKTCESKGPGILVHPTRGSIRVSCTKIKVSDEIIDGSGVSNYELEFIEANEWVGSTSASLAAVAGVTGLTPVIAALATSFNAAYHVDAISILDVTAAQATAQRGVAQVATQFGAVVGLSADKNVWRIQSDLDSVASQSGAVAKTSTAWLAISNGIAAIDRYGVSKTAKVDAYRRLINWAAQGSTLAGAGGAAQEAVLSTIRVLGAAYLARVGASTSAKTSQDACRLYAMVLKVLDEESAIARQRCDDVLHLALREFTAKAQTALLARVYDAPTLIEYNFNAGVCSLVAAHEIFGDAKRFAEIEATNPYAMPIVIGPLVRAYQTAAPG